MRTISPLDEGLRMRKLVIAGGLIASMQILGSFGALEPVFS
jgi:hypothetical protein